MNRILLLLGTALIVAAIATLVNDSIARPADPYLFGKGSLANTVLEVIAVSENEGSCGGDGYVVREVGGPIATFEVVVFNRSYGTGNYIHVHGYWGPSGCEPVPNKYSLIEQ